MLLIWILLLFGVQTLLGSEYLGCYKSSDSDPELSVLSSKDVGSPTGCIDECRLNYYMFAGLMASQKCYCGSTYGRNELSENCDNCVNNATAKCGSFNAMSIYATGQKGPSPPRRVEAIHEKAGALLVTWQPPDNPNGNLTSYTVRAVAIETHAFNPLPLVEVQVEGGSSNSTVLSDLHPGTKFNISVTAKNLKGSSDPAFTTGWTLIGPPNKPETPKILKTSGNTMTIQLSEGKSENGPITFYQVVVVVPTGIPPTGTNIAYPSYNQSNEDDIGYYVTGEFDAYDFPKYQKFVVGDGRNIGGYYNAPLKEDSILPQVGLVLVSRNRDSAQYSYSDLTYDLNEHSVTSQTNTATTVLWLCIGIVGLLLFLAILIFFILRRRTEQRMHRPSDQQELQIQGPMYEVDNRAYIPDDVPERVNHYQELQVRVKNIPRNNINYSPEVIRRGQYGNVYRGVYQKEGIPISVSIQDIAENSMKQSKRKKMLRELDVCIKAGSMEYLIDLMGICETPDTALIIMEMPPKTLKQKLLDSRAGEIFPSEHFLKIGAKIASALKHLEEKKIVHTHLCARSVGIYSDYTPKVMGHGISVYALEEFKYTRWTAIECFESKIKHQPGVVWAFGVLLWEILSLGATPFAHLSLDSDVETAMKNGERLKKLEDVPDPVCEVMHSCWSSDHKERPTFDELTRLDTLSVLPIRVTEEYRAELELHEC